VGRQLDLACDLQSGLGDHVADFIDIVEMVQMIDSRTVGTRREEHATLRRKQVLGASKKCLGIVNVLEHFSQYE
jgi:hypothetical protein